jgi:predicted transcriptional regulator YheO
MAVHGDAAIPADAEAGAVVGAGAVGEAAGFGHEGGDGAAGAEHGVPAGEVAHGGDEAAGALHDLTTPERAIVQIENNLSGRKVGGPVTELGLARITNPDFPDVVTNYPNAFADGREVKSTSIGIRDSGGRFVGPLCLNIDVSYFKSIASYLGEFTRTQTADAGFRETLDGANAVSIEEEIRSFSAARNKGPRALTSEERREIITQLADRGFFERRGAAEQVARMIGSSRSGVYYYLNGAAT